MALVGCAPVAVAVFALLAVQAVQGLTGAARHVKDGNSDRFDDYLEVPRLCTRDYYVARGQSTHTGDYA